MKIKYWTEIKAEFLKGATPQELGKKYGVTAKRISDKACEEKWVAERKKIAEEVREKVQQTIEDKITSLTDKALVVLEDILTDSEIKPEVKVQAVGKVLDISGLKFEKKELTTGSDLTIQVVKKEQE